jgi:hypothetical protein
MFNFKKKEVVDNGRFCQECSHKKWLPIFRGKQFCLHCMKNTITNISISVSDTITMHESLKMKKKSLNFKGFVSQSVSGWFSSFRYKDGVEKSRILDKEKDEYHEVIKDYKTGEIVHEDHGKLSEHTGHGSAKKHEIKS